MSRTHPRSTSRSMVAGPSPAMSIWSRATKKRRRPRTWSGHAPLGQNECAPCTVRALPHDGQSAGMRQTGSPAGSFSSTRSTAGMTSPRLDTATVSPTASSRLST